MDVLITYKREGFKLAAYSDAKCSNSPESGKSTSSCIVMLINDPISFEVGLQSLTAQSTMEAELVASGLTMKEVALCSNMIVKLGFEKGISSVSLYLDKLQHYTSPAIVHTPLGRKNVALRHVLVQELFIGGRYHHYLLREHL